MIGISLYKRFRSMGYSEEDALLLVEAVEEEVPPIEQPVKTRSADAIRQARYRERKRNKTVTPVTEEARTLCEYGRNKTVTNHNETVTLEGGIIGGEVLSFEEKKKERNTPPTPSPLPVTPVFPDSEDIELALDAYNQVAENCGLPKVVKLTDTRRKKLKARLKDAGSLDGFYEVCRALQRAKFCHGRNNRGWCADFDFLLQEQSFNRLREGFYDKLSAGGVS